MRPRFGWLLAVDRIEQVRCPARDDLLHKGNRCSGLEPVEAAFILDPYVRVRRRRPITAAAQF